MNLYGSQQLRPLRYEFIDRLKESIFPFDSQKKRNLMIKDLLKEKLSESVMAHLKRYVFKVGCVFLMVISSGQNPHEALQRRQEYAAHLSKLNEVLDEGDLEVTPGHFKRSFSRTIRCEMISCQFDIFSACHFSPTLN